MKYCFDLDGTLCNNTYGNYETAVPFRDRINYVNFLYKNGNIIFIESARGTTTNIDWLKFTEKQLNEWGLKYHTLRTGVKIDADFYIDDKGIKDTSFFIEKDNKYS